jgi:ParB family chromosome partitioning protein
MARRAANIFAQKVEGKEATPPVKHDDSEIDKGPSMTGNWSRIAYKTMEDKLAGKTDELNILLQSQLQGILSGSIPVVISEDQIRDDLGTDRISNAPESQDDGSSLEDLTNNIRQRGLRTPIRVRPADLSWRPDPENPFDMSGQEFLLQSGRRRLAACRDIGVQPIAFLSFPENQRADVEDLHERYFENVARRDLTTAERLFSIGLISARMPNLSQSQAADILHTSQPMVSRGASLYQHFEELSERLNLGEANIAQIDAALKAIKKGSQSPQEASSAPNIDPSPLPFTRKTVGVISARLSRASDGKAVLTLKAPDVNALSIERLLEILEKQATQESPEVQNKN